MIKDKIETLNFFKYLCEVEIDELNTEEKVRLNNTIHSIVSKSLFHGPQKISSNDGIYDTGIAWDEIYELGLRDLQAWFKDKFFQIMTAITKDYECKGEMSAWSTDKEIVGGFFAPLLLEPFYIPLLSRDFKIKDFRISANIRIKPQYKTEGSKAYSRWDPEWRKNGEIIVKSRISLKNGLLVAFLKSINGLPPDAFRLCPACDRWYFHLSKRERKYCSEKCTKKMQARNRRAKEKRKRAKKSSGPNVKTPMLRKK